MYKKICTFIKISMYYAMRNAVRYVMLCAVLCFLLTACGTPKEKIALAQEKYVQLSEIHNQVVEAHKNVEDNSLDEELTELRSRASEVGTYNLAEMAEDEIDQVIADIDSMINEYENYLAQLSGIKGEEEEAVLTPIVITLMNHTDISFSDLRLHEQGSSGVLVNVLENLESFVPGQYLTGLTVMRDVDNTPWVLVLADEAGTEYEVVLAVEEYREESVSLELGLDGESGELTAKLMELDSDAEQEESDDGEEDSAGDESDEDAGKPGAEAAGDLPDGDTGGQ